MRQSDPRPIDDAVKPARGLLHKRTSFEHFELTRFEPSDDLKDWVEHHWMVLYDLGDRPPYPQRNLSHPNQHLVVDSRGETGIFGAATGVFETVLDGSGRVFATKFWPGAFRPFFGRPVSALSDTFVPVEAVFARSSAALQEEFTGLNDPLGMAERLEDVIRARLPDPDEKAGLARQIVQFAEANLELVSAGELAAAFGLGLRTLQRLLDEYVGVSPKWVIDRYRMLEAVEALNAGGAETLTELAHRLGYFDQAAFNHAFEKLTGAAPKAFRAR
ncbi:helix-turn-helix domain-containing protein [Devosia sp. ZB163]|uniref:AraC family transcriptional regulator n=1 Tax=Devosia sp. ZB163 TaxID=3025938 RepID=UPI00235EB15E|nr:helix-turn-helix domain-containing protein [Devosia sp. ZB163]MDC9824117.1 helix-turn-helix domain-containing protein [Devosia sp. ZB163]